MTKKTFHKDRRQSDSKDINSELIGIVYEMAFDPSFWPDLLESINSLFEDRRSKTKQPKPNNDNGIEPIPLFSSIIDGSEAQRLVTLLPHLYQALKLKRDYNETEHLKGQAQAIIEHFPIGVLLVSATGRIISANQLALETISNNLSIQLREDVIHITPEKQNLHFLELIDKAANTLLNDATDSISSFKITEQKNSQAISLLITPDPYPQNTYDKHITNCAAVFITSTSAKHKISESTLQTLFNLTQAEARLTALLTSGMSLTQSAEQISISKNTAKVQLQSIFTKMNVSRQAQLMKLILTSPAVFFTPDSQKEKVNSESEKKLITHINKEGQIILKDGRHLQFAEFGDPDGIPVIHLHGILGCRYERFPDDNLTKELGVRLIVPDRPGYGLSDFAERHGYLDLVDDLIELIDYLDIQQCSIMGLSVGAIYGSAFAYKTPQRLHRIAMISSTPPFRSFSDFTNVPPSLKLLITFSKYLPTVAHVITEIAIKNACKNPKKFLETIPACTSDKIIFTHSRLKQHIQECLLAGSKEVHSGFIHDILLSAQPWPFPVKDIQTKIDFWHGTNDQHSPINRIKPIIEAVPNKCFHQIDGGGHFLIYEHWQEILETLIH